MPVITGTTGSDTLIGTADVDEIYGLDGDDVIDGGFGADRLYGGSGNDIFRFTSVSFTFPTPPTGTIDGGDGVDEIDARYISPGAFNIFSADNRQFRAGNQGFSLTSIEVIRPDWRRLVCRRYDSDGCSGATDMGFEHEPFALRRRRHRRRSGGRLGHSAGRGEGARGGYFARSDQRGS